jgi:GTPase SAR1 family protein
MKSSNPNQSKQEE